jgi:hypothetical protein
VIYLNLLDDKKTNRLNETFVNLKSNEFKSSNVKDLNENNEASIFSVSEIKLLQENVQDQEENH